MSEIIEFEVLHNPKNEPPRKWISLHFHFRKEATFSTNTYRTRRIFATMVYHSNQEDGKSKFFCG